MFVRDRLRRTNDGVLPRPGRGPVPKLGGAARRQNALFAAAPRCSWVHKRTRYFLRVTDMVAFVVVPPDGVKVAFAASLRWLERSSTRRPLPVKMILTLIVPVLRMITFAAATRRRPGCDLAASGRACGRTSHSPAVTKRTFGTRTSRTSLAVCRSSCGCREFCVAWRVADRRARGQGGGSGGSAGGVDRVR